MSNLFNYFTKLHELLSLFRCERTILN